MSASSAPRGDRDRPRRRAVTVPVLVVAAAVLAAALVGAVAGGWLTPLALIPGAVVTVGCAAVPATARRSTRRRHAAVRTLRHKADVVEVWGAVGLKDALAGEKAQRALVRARRRTPLSLAVGSEGVELWAGGRVPSLVYSVRWSAVEAFEAAAGRSASALVLVTARGNRLVLEPARRAGSLVRAREGAVRELVARLEVARAAGVTSETARSEAGLRRRRR
ncbi:hypothetical protein [Cellulomonas shaoxiangyii]|uniref:Uncharacterized protein n=1 Tax=Cellulomonas shaoxiangyii TaxID=2566013 RepID=A0A4P7SI81_9CELL|nr:hypothetical protein [Cellulomonas shaoxiangyii]QCB92354.1 hypothetical protein E5225_01060 [Cellulomonas shaoxiangyii]TGY86251.1 hypothetical protein E5226_02805 [Cellulomonas shaoxiangyii]